MTTVVRLLFYVTNLVFEYLLLLHVQTAGRNLVQSGVVVDDTLDSHTLLFILGPQLLLYLVKNASHFLDEHKSILLFTIIFTV